MTIDPAWLAPASLAEASRVQRAIAARVEMADRFGAVAMIAGADTSNKWRDSRGPVHAAIAPLRPAGAGRTDPFASSPGDGCDVLPAGTATLTPLMPYVPGYLGFREAPALIAAWDMLAEKPDLLFVDGHGRAHPRRCGVASHLGVLLDTPTIGIAKSLLCGRIEGEVGPAPGDRAPIVDRGEVVGMALRTSARGGPIFVGIGHRVSLETAVAWALRLSEGRRLPLPIRLAHDAANMVRRRHEGLP